MIMDAIGNCAIAVCAIIGICAAMKVLAFARQMFGRRAGPILALMVLVALFVFMATQVLPPIRSTMDALGLAGILGQ